MIEFNATTLEKAETLLGGIKDALPGAASRAINRSVTTARAEMVRSVRREYIVNAAAVRNTLVVTTARPNLLLAAVRSTGSPIALSKFDISPSKPVKRVKGSLTGRVKKASGRKPIKSAFVASMASGHVGVFKRTGKKRLPIDQTFGPSVPQMIGAENVSKQIEEKAQSTLDNRLNHEINRILEAGHL